MYKSHTHTHIYIYIYKLKNSGHCVFNKKQSANYMIDKNLFG